MAKEKLNVDVERTDAGDLKTAVNGKIVEHDEKRFGKLKVLRIALDNSTVDEEISKAYIGGMAGATPNDKLTPTTLAKMYGGLKGQKEVHAKGDPITPEYNFDGLKQFLEESPYHFRCITLRTKDVVHVFEIKEITEKYGRKVDKPNKMKKRVQLSILEEWLDLVNEGEDRLEDIISKVIFDMHAFGNGRLEVARRRGGKIGRIGHLQAETIQAYWDRPDLLSQEIDEQTVRWFQKFGLKRIKGKWILIDSKNGKKFNGKDPIKAGNEILTFMHDHPRDRVYGVPPIITGLKAIDGNVKVRDHNINWFLRPLPSHLGILQGGDVDDETNEQLQQYFQDIERGGRSIILLGLPRVASDMKLEWQKFDTSINEFPFVEYTLLSRDEIVVADGLVLARLGISTEGTRGSGDSISQIDTYRTSTIPADETYIEGKMAYLLREGLGVDQYYLDLNTRDLRDLRKLANLCDTLVRGGLSTQNEARIRMGLNPMSDPKYDQLQDLDKKKPRGASTTPKERVGEETRS